MNRPSQMYEAEAGTLIWTLSNTLPAKIAETDLKADGDEFAVESIEIAHERLRSRTTDDALASRPRDCALACSVMTRP